MKKLISLVSLVVAISSPAMASAESFLKVCHGISNQGSVEVQILRSNVSSSPVPPLEGYFKAVVLLNGKMAYSTEYAVHSLANDEYFTSGNSEFMIAGPPMFTDTRLYLEIRNSDGTLSGPSFNTISMACISQAIDF